MKINFDEKYRFKIREMIKNKIDISEAIKDRNIKGEDLSGAIISELDIHDEDVTGCNFANCIIGRADNIVNFNRTIAQNCCFVRTVCSGRVWARRADFRGSNLKGAFLPYVDYKYAIMDNCNFCNTVFSLGTAYSYGASFSKDFFQDLGKALGLVILYKDEYEQLLNNKSKE